jgi:hypothetical protein
MKEIKIINQESPFYQKKGLGVRSTFHDFLCVYFDGEPTFKIFNPDEIEVSGPAAAPAATLLAYNQLQGKEFPITALITRVRSICERDGLMDGTITKRLRNLRSEGLVNYEYDEANKKYRKL